jgi:hypothetical protein
MGRKGLESGLLDANHVRIIRTLQELLEFFGIPCGTGSKACKETRGQASASSSASSSTKDRIGMHFAFIDSILKQQHNQPLRVFSYRLERTITIPSDNRCRRLLRFRLETLRRRRSAILLRHAAAAAAANVGYVGLQTIPRTVQLVVVQDERR